MIQPIAWKNNQLYLIDQLALPLEKIEKKINDPNEAALAIKNMLVRGAPAIGITAAFGIVLAAEKYVHNRLEDAKKNLLPWFKTFADTRPTAVNLFWALKIMQQCSEKSYPSSQDWYHALKTQAQRIHQDDIAACKRMGEHGADYLKELFTEKLAKHEKLSILTHCNAGALATGGWGTALGIVRTAYERDMLTNVWVDETRPYLQGARLTTWELMQDNIPCTLITDNMAGYFMQQNKVDVIIVGADRIAANGDTANKIGTYSLAVLAKFHEIPFLVAAPSSTFDLSAKNALDIPIEQRSSAEITQLGNIRIAPVNTQAAHPAFDVTPAQLIKAIITEKAVVKQPYDQNISKYIA